MIVNQHGMPLFTQAYSGNSSDKETIVEAMKRLKENIEFPDDVYFIEALKLAPKIGILI